eukprot:Lithocolla_globosa_v1_NODE_4379_length_1426_cov_10.559140.p2 type:complete len:159 gc:universal NODE_4379_length_1426_cov_10.559140:1375-899(-)
MLAIICFFLCFLVEANSDYIPYRPFSGLRLESSETEEDVCEERYQYLPDGQRVLLDLHIKDYVEDEEEYKEGGYHPVEVGEKFNNGEFICIGKLGHGHFSTVWLMWSEKKQDFRAVKIMKSKSKYQRLARDEEKLCRHAANGDRNHLGYHHVCSNGAI